ncbi:TipJ family phage tail tip protein [Methylobacterium nodulans]|uniref:Fibronectin type III domain protein n=1 Tax=Methylobacterium nodulans (strain LMG 21967 / CNCM I-2342 / ORS 2060) TaxID=460265 RepID=B8IIX0_METNO|nr:phage tail protein [Methylobacterium nodulans]ACL61765.1 Fibronectin type III domain protein [Methylobacterium nodulans ORS 2060]
MDRIDGFDPAARDDEARPDAAPIRGRKSSSGGGKTGGSGSNAPDTLFSNATVRLVDLIGEGEIKGVVGGLKGVYFNDVPVQNEDGSFNYKGLSADFRTGTPDQSYMPGYPDVETPQDVGVTVKQAVPHTASISDGEADRARVIIELPALFLAKNDGSVRQNNVSFRIEARYSGGPWVNQLGDLTITGKNTSPYFVSYEVDLPRNPAGSSPPWQVRVTRLTPDTDDFNNSQDKWTSQSDLIFYSLTAIQDAKFSYPHSALVGLTADASQFGASVPARTYLVEGLLVKIPSNYDPVARTYAGIWDGTFKEDWTDNPAWVFHDLLWNDRYGLGEFIDIAAIDKWTLYQIGAYCDVLVSDGKGGQEPRFRFNAQITQLADAFDLLQQISAIWRGMAYWSSGAVTATQDRPDDVRALVTPANVIDGLITYSSSARKARHTVALVTWNDPTDLYKPQIEVVEHNEGVARYGYNPTKIDLLGCTSRGQAHREGLWRLLVEQYATQTVTYRAGLDHAVRRPGDIIAIADPQISNIDVGGRVLAGANWTDIPLDRAVELKAGVSYTLSMQLPDGSVQERALSSVSTDEAGRTIAHTEPFTADAQPGAVWQITGEIVPQLFRIVGIKEVEPHIYEIQALQHEPSIYAAVDDGAAFEPLKVSEFPDIVLAPTNLTVRESTYFENNLPRQALLLSWTAGQPFNSVAYYVTAVKPNGSLVTLPKTSSTSVEFLDAATGEWTFIVQAEGLNGRLSDAAQITFTVQGWEGIAGPTVTGLQVKGGGSVFTGRSCTLEWGLTWPADVTPYEVGYAFRVFDADTDAFLHQEIITAAQATYDYDENVNEGGPRRRFKVSVAARDAIGRESQPAVLVVSNPPPAMVVPTLDWTTESIGVWMTPPADTDLAGVLIWLSKTNGFNPVTTAPAADLAPTGFTLLPAEAETTYYVRVAFYDSFGKNPAELNISPQIEIRTTNLLFDVQAPDIPTGLALATALEVSATGVATSRIDATWNAVGSDNLGIYEFELTEGDGITAPSWVRDRSDKGQPRFTWRNLKPGQLYTARVRSVNAQGIAPSGWSVPASIVAAKNLNKPGAITNFVAEATFQAAYLSWANPADPDLAYVEVWIGTRDDGADATLFAKVPVPLAFFTDTTLGIVQVRKYWVRPVNSSGTPGDFAGPRTATTAALPAAALQNAIIDATKIASSLVAPAAVSSLPDPATWTGPDLAYNATDGKLYRRVNGQWTAGVPTVDLVGALTTEQQQAIDLAKLSGTLTEAQIDQISAAKIVGDLVNAQISMVQVQGTLTDAQQRLLDLSKLSGQLTAQQYSQIDAAKVVGDLVSAQISMLQVQGTLTDEQQRLLDLAKLGGQLTEQQYSQIDAAKVVGNLASAQISMLQVQGTLTDAQQQALNLARLGGQIQRTQVSDNAIDTPQLNAGAVKTAQLYAGAVVASKLAVASLNLASNGGLQQGTSGWLGSAGGTGITPIVEGVRTDYAPAGMRVFSTRYDDGSKPTSGVSEIVYRNPDAAGIGQLIRITPGAPYEFSAYISAHRCTAYVSIIWWDANSAYITEVGGNIVTDTQYGAGSALSEWDKHSRSWVIATAPANAAFADIRIRWTGFGTQPYCMAGGLMFAQAVAGQTEPSPYSDAGVTMIEGGQIRTRSIGADKIVARAITAGEIATGTITATEIAGATITGDKIAGRTITASQIATGTLTATELAAGSVTTSKLAVASLNLAINGDMGNLNTFGNPAAWSSDSSQIAGATMLPSGVDYIYCPAGMRAMKIAATAVPTNQGSIGQVWLSRVETDGTLYPFSCRAGTTYEVSAYLSTHRCTGYVGLVWYDANQAYMGESWGSQIVNWQGSIYNPQSDWELLGRSKLIVIAPAGAVYCRPYVRYGGTWYPGQDIPYCFISGVMLAVAVAGQTEVSPFSPAGLTTINGASIRTSSIAADKIIAKSITAGQIATGTITATEIAGGTITGDRIAGNTITGGNINAGTLTARELAAGSITGYKLAISTGNFAFNSEGNQSTRGWSASVTTWGAPISMFVDAFWMPSGMTGIGAHPSDGGAPAGGYFDLVHQTVDPATGNPKNYPVQGGAWYEFSAYANAHRCDVQCYIGWADSAGTVISYSSGQVIPQGSRSGGTIRDFPRFTCITQAPGNAASCFVIYRGINFTGADPFIFVTGTMYAGANSSQTECSPYVAPAVTKIDGGSVVTNSLSADRIVARSITAGQIAVGAITATEIGGSTITGDRIAGSTITGDKIQVRTISASNLVGGTITAYEIAVRTITASNLVGGTITAYEIASRTITADKLVANSITAGEIQAGAIGVDQLAAGAITADKIGVGLNSTNLLYNSDFKAGAAGAMPPGVSGWGSSVTVSAPYIGLNQSGPSWQPNGMGSLQMSCAGTPPAGQIMDAYLAYPRQDGGWEAKFPVVGGKRYEVSGYVSAHRSQAYIVVSWYDAGGNYLGATTTTVVENQMSTGNLNAWARCTGMGTAPGGAATATVSLRMSFNGGDGPYNFWSGIYFAQAKNNQTQYSDWAPGSATVIWGGVIATRSITADRIAVRSLTADLIVGATITGYEIAGSTITGAHIQSNSIYADKIQVGGGQSLTSWMGSDTTKINGGAIEANSIRVNTLTVGLRGVRTVGLDFSVDKNTRTISWTAGFILWIDDAGNNVASQVPAGTANGGATFVYVWWNKFTPNQLNAAANNWNDIFTDKNTILLASYDGYAGLNVLLGGTIIDGTRINTGTITANQIAANAIQASHIAANQIQASHISAGQVTADKIGAGMMNAGAIQLGSTLFVMETYQGSGWGRIFARDSNQTLRVAVGYIEDLSGGGWGLAMWDAAGNLIINGTGLNGGGIWARSIAADKLVANSITANELSTGQLISQSAQIGNLVVDNLQVNNNAITQTVWGQSAGDDIYCWINIRQPNTRVEIGMYFSGTGGSGYALGTAIGALDVYRSDGPHVLSGNCAYHINSTNNLVYMGPTCYVTVDVVANPGVYWYRLVNSNAARASGTTFMKVTELSR